MNALEHGAVKPSRGEVKPDSGAATRWASASGGQLQGMNYGLGMKFVCRITERDGQWVIEHAGSEIGPIRVTARTREEALQKMDGEIHYWLEMCPCTGETYRDVKIELVDSA